jgi:predicted HicB family RNase H-like nuclease
LTSKPPSATQLRLTVRFRNEKEEKIKDELEKEAKKQSKSLNDLIIEACESYLRENSPEIMKAIDNPYFIF